MSCLEYWACHHTILGLQIQTSQVFDQQKVEPKHLPIGFLGTVQLQYPLFCNGLPLGKPLNLANYVSASRNRKKDTAAGLSMHSLRAKLLGLGFLKHICLYTIYIYIYHT